MGCKVPLQQNHQKLMAGFLSFIYCPIEDPQILRQPLYMNEISLTEKLNFKSMLLYSIHQFQMDFFKCKFFNKIENWQKAFLKNNKLQYSVDLY